MIDRHQPAYPGALNPVGIDQRRSCRLAGGDGRCHGFSGELAVWCRYAADGGQRPLLNAQLELLGFRFVVDSSNSQTGALGQKLSFPGGRYLEANLVSNSGFVMF